MPVGYDWWLWGLNHAFINKKIIKKLGCSGKPCVTLSFFTLLAFAFLSIYIHLNIRPKGKGKGKDTTQDFSPSTFWFRG